MNEIGKKVETKVIELNKAGKYAYCVLGQMAGCSGTTARAILIRNKVKYNMPKRRSAKYRDKRICVYRSPNNKEKDLIEVINDLTRIIENFFLSSRRVTALLNNLTFYMQELKELRDE